MARTGPKSRCSAELAKVVAQEILRGRHQIGACAIAGVALRTHHDWMQRGAEGNEEYADYYRIVITALEDRVAEMLAADDSKLGMWLAERVYSRAYHLPTKLQAEVSGPSGGPIQTQALERLSTAQLAAMADEPDDPDGDEG